MLESINEINQNVYWLLQSIQALRGSRFQCAVLMGPSLTVHHSGLCTAAVGRRNDNRDQ